MPHVQMYRSKSGGLFETEFEEHRDDLRALIAKLCDNEPMAKQLSEKLTNGVFSEFHATVIAMWNCRPDAPQVAGIGPLTTAIIGPPLCEHGKPLDEQCRPCGRWCDTAPLAQSIDEQNARLAKHHGVQVYPEPEAIRMPPTLPNTCKHGIAVGHLCEECARRVI